MVSAPEENLVEVKELIMKKDAEMNDEKIVEPIEGGDDPKTINDVPEVSNAEQGSSNETTQAVDDTTTEAEEADEDEDEEVEGEEEAEGDEEEDEDAEEEPEVDLDAPDAQDGMAEVDLDEPKEEEESDPKCDITETLDLEQSLTLPQEEHLPKMQVSSSELTKSLRQVRLNKKTAGRSPLKEKWQPRDLTPDLEKEEDEIDDDEDDEEGGEGEGGAADEGG